MAEYSATRRTPRKHKRVVMKGTEQFDADGVKLEPGDMQTRPTTAIRRRQTHPRRTAAALGRF